MFQTLRDDIRCVLMRDPACRNWLEVLFCYPGYRAVRMYRRAHRLYQKGFRFWARLISSRCHFRTGVDIHPAATIGQRLFIDHGTGVVIGETTVIGDDVTLYQGAILGGTGKETGKRHPTVGNHVTICAGAAVLGPLHIGDHAKIGAGAVVLSDVPRFATVVGVPGHIVRQNGCTLPCNEQCDCKSKDDCPLGETCSGEAGVDLDQLNLPDPVQQQINELNKRLEKLENGNRA